MGYKSWSKWPICIFSFFIIRFKSFIHLNDLFNFILKYLVITCMFFVCHSNIYRCSLKLLRNMNFMSLHRTIQKQNNHTLSYCIDIAGATQMDPPFSVHVHKFQMLPVDAGYWGPIYIFDVYFNNSACLLPVPARVWWPIFSIYSSKTRLLPVAASSEGPTISVHTLGKKPVACCWLWLETNIFDIYFKNQPVAGCG